MARGSRSKRRRLRPVRSCASSRASGSGLTGDRERPLDRESGADHRREPARRQGGGRCRVRRHHQRGRFVRISSDGGGQQHDARAHHPRGRGSAGREGADATLRRPVCARLYADRFHAGGGRCRHSAAVLRGRVVRLDLQGAGAARDRLPVRAGDFHARHHCQRPCRRGAITAFW